MGTMQTGAEPEYVMGRSPAETTRLRLQSSLYNGATRRLFEEAGIGPGMKVLDVGSGAGDVAMLAAELVGPSGQVVGVDANASILDTARERAAAAGLTHVAFVAQDIRDASLDADFDAIVGRAVLVYVSEPAAVLRRLADHARPGAAIAVQELDWSIGPVATPPSRLLNQAWSWAAASFRRGGLDPHLGLRLDRVFRDAGLPMPTMHLFAPVGGGPDWAGYEYMASGLRSSLPAIVGHGIATEAEVGVETFAERLRAEVVAQDGVFALPTFVGAWTRRP